MASSNTGTAKRGRGRPKGSKSSYTMTENALAQRRENSATKYARNDEEREYNARLIDHVMRVNEIATHADKNDLSTLKSCFIAYLHLCQEDGFNISNIAAYASMGFPSAAHFERFLQKDNPEIKAFAASVKQTCAMFRETLVADSKLNPVIGIFWQRNFDGLRNDTEQVQAAQEQEDDFTAAKSYKEKYKNLIGE